MTLNGSNFKINPVINSGLLNINRIGKFNIFRVLFLILFFKSITANAGIEPELRVFRTGTGLVINDTMNIYDHVLLNWDGSTTGISPSYYHLRKCKTYITLEINQETIKDCNLSNFTYSVVLNLTANDENGSPLSFNPPNSTITLQIDYDNTTGNNYTDKHTIEIDGAYWLSAQISGISNSSINDYVKISLGTVIERYQDIYPPNHPSFNAITVDASKNEFIISWQPQYGAEEYDLEWAWYDDYPATGATPLASSAIAWTFMDNASRVTVKGNSYKFSNIFERGYLITRIRGVGYTGTNFDNRVTGVWTSDNYSGFINAFIQNDSYHLYDITISGSGLNEHEPYLNWQYQVTFAEEGKKKEVMSYFDGSLRGRQIVTKTNSNGEAIVAETVYDFQGRAAVSFLPAPTFQQKLKFYGNFNLSSVTNKPYDKSDFDVSGSNCSAITNTASENSGASKYYSVNNPLVGNMHYEYLPHAEGFPFTVTEYMPDGTGRIKRQGGVGADHKLGSNHETSYFYGVPEQVELDRLFGSNVGYNSHYQKNMVVDPNGQVSVSYLDLKGKVIATALAGAVPNTVAELANRTTPIALESNVSEGAIIEMMENGIMLSKKFDVAQPTLYKFGYQLDIPRFTDASKPNLCFDCVYDITISLKDACGNEMLDGNPNVTGNQPVVRVLGKPGTNFDLNCENGGLSFSFTNDALINNQYLQVTLNLGSYTLSRTLSTNMKALSYYEEQFVNQNTEIKTEEDFRDAYIDRIDYSGCGLTCATCEATYGVYSTFLSTNLQKLINEEIVPNKRDTINIKSMYDEGMAMCARICENPNSGGCDIMLQVLKADVTPGGQYAKYVTSEGNTTFYGLLNTSVSNVAGFNWQHYRNTSTTELKIDYTDFNGKPVKVLYKGEWVSPYEINSPWDIMNVFNDKMAEALVKYHPEYCTYQQCVLNNKSEVYDRNMLKTNTFAAAVDSGFLNPLGDNSKPFYNSLYRGDPYFKTSGQGSGKLTDFKNLMGSYTNFNNSNCSYLSLWDLVKATYLCNLSSCGNINSCLSSTTWTSVTCKPYLDLIWAQFRATYLAEKTKIKEVLLANACPVSPYISASSASVRFMKIQSAIDLLPSTANTEPTIKIHQRTLINKECDTACEAYADIWMKKLEGCNLTTTVAADLRAKLIIVCKNGCDENNPLGSSSSDPKKQRITSSYNSFQEVWNYFVNKGYINPTTACDINLIGFPKEYGHNYTAVEKDPAKCRAAYSPADSCMFKNNNGDSRKASVVTVTPISTPCKKCIDCEKMHLAVKALQKKYNNNFLDTNSNTQQIAENFFNNYLNFNLTYFDYAIFMKQCRGDSAYSNLDLTVWYYFNETFTYVPFKQLKPHTNPINASDDWQWAGMDKFLAFPPPPPSGYKDLDTCHCRLLAELEVEWLANPQGTFNDYVKTARDCIGEFDFSNILTKCRAIYNKGIYNQDLLMRSWTPDNLYELKYALIFGNLYVPNCMPDCESPNNITVDCSIDCDDFLDFMRDYDDQYSTSIESDIRHAKYPYNNDNSGSLRLFIQAFHQHFPDNPPCYPGDLRTIPKSPEELGNRTISSFLMKYAGCVVKDQECDTILPPPLNCCTASDTNIVNRLQNFLNKLTTTWSGTDNHMAHSTWKMSPNFGSFYNSRLYDGLSKTTLRFKEIPYYTSPNGKSGIYITLKDTLGFEGTLIMQQIMGTGPQVYWGLITKFWNLTPAPNCHKSEWFQVYIEQVDPITLLKDTFILCGSYDKASFIAPCYRAEQLCDRGMTIDISTIDRCREQLEVLAKWQAGKAYKDYMDSIRYDFRERYLAKCRESWVDENFTMQWEQQEFHYTLYYYDQAGNLIQTVPPAGTVPISSSTTLATIKTQRKAGNNPTYDVHNLVTRYTFNTLNQLVKQNTPDAGESKFWYDIVGRLVISQNAKQLPNHQYSYTVYDNLGRITEVGQADNTILMSVAKAFNPTNLATWIGNATKDQVTRTLYDVATLTIGYNSFSQDNLRGRVVNVIYQGQYDSDNSNYDQAVHYDYDIHGNVRQILRENKSTVITGIGHQFKQVNYDYDLISGKVNYVYYQKGYEDQFIHRYQYDADNRIIEAQTSTDGRHWDRDARYSYLKHGPLNRTELGQLMVQGLDYNYTLHGWLKGVNSASLNVDRDPGHDGISFSTSGIHANVARDVMGFNLGYYATDYKPISDYLITPIPTANKFLPEISGSMYNATTASLYNGNIRMMQTGLKPIIDGTSQHIGMAYRYDQLNRISSTTAWDNYNSSTNVWATSGLALVDYSEHFEYDPNGNITSLNRKGGTSLSSTPPPSTNMDDMTYHYYYGTNKLEYVDDNTGYSSNYTDDIDDQSSFNYQYDAIGNLISDVAEDIQSIEWTVYGKIKSIIRGTPSTTNPNLEFTYTPDGHRATKKVIDGSGNATTTYYICDAQGNQMATYTISNENTITWQSSPIYGSSRIGTYEPNKVLNANSDANDAGHTCTWLQSQPQGYYEYNLFRGQRRYELSNHLGNVLAVISDKRSAVCVSGSIDHYEADIIQVTDYYCFGSPMPGRIYSASGVGKYRYGFNGKEKDDETYGDGNCIAFEARIFDSRIGRFFSTDAREGEYPWQSTYVYFANSPISILDHLGMGEGDAPKETTQHEVKNGETLWGIAKSNFKEHGKGMTFEQYWDGVQKWNKNSDYGTIGAKVNLENPIQSTASTKSKSPYPATTYNPRPDRNKECGFIGPIIGCLIDEANLGLEEAGVTNPYIRGTIITTGVVVTWILTKKVCAPSSVSSTGRVFWSGSEEAEVAATKFALKTGGATLGMTTSGKIMTTLSPIIPKYIARPIINRMSANFAKGAEVSATVFQAETGVGLKSTFRMFEYPALKNNSVNIFFQNVSGL